MARRLIALLCSTLLTLSASAAHGAASPARLFLLVRDGHGVRVDADSISDGEVLVFPLRPDSEFVDLVLPVGPGRSAALVRPGDASAIVVRRRGNVLEVSTRMPNGDMRPRPGRSMADLALEETRLCVTGGNGARASFVLTGAATCERDSVGPVANMFAGKLPFALKDGDWIVQTETWRRPANAAPAGRMTLARGRWLYADAVRADGTRSRFVVDLGASESVVAPDFVPGDQPIERAQMTEYSAGGAAIRAWAAEGATGATSPVRGVTTFPTLDVGGVRVDSLEAIVMPLPPGLGDDVRGILGLDVLRRADRVRLEFVSGNEAVLVCEPPAPLAHPAGTSAFAWVNGHVVLSGEVGGLAARWLLDSGAPESFVDSVAVAPTRWAREGGAPMAVRGAGERRVDSRRAVAPTLRVGSAASWRGVPVRVANLAPFDVLRDGDHVPALLGLPELARMGALELDFRAHRATWRR